MLFMTLIDKKGRANRYSWLLSGRQNDILMPEFCPLPRYDTYINVHLTITIKMTLYGRQIDDVWWYMTFLPRYDTSKRVFNHIHQNDVVWTDVKTTMSDDTWRAFQPLFNILNFQITC